MGEGADKGWQQVRGSSSSSDSSTYYQIIGGALLTASSLFPHSPPPTAPPGHTAPPLPHSLRPVPPAPPHQSPPQQHAAVVGVGRCVCVCVFDYMHLGGLGQGQCASIEGGSSRQTGSASIEQVAARSLHACIRNPLLSPSKCTGRYITTSTTTTTTTTGTTVRQRVQHTLLRWTRRPSAALRMAPRAPKADSTWKVVSSEETNHVGVW